MQNSSLHCVPAYGSTCNASQNPAYDEIMPVRFANASVVGGKGARQVKIGALLILE